MLNSIYELGMYFIIYAFLGWCVEVAYAAFVKGEFVNRGFLNGPVCPIYGFGMVIIISVLTPLKSNLLLLFLGSVILTSLLELVTGYVLEKVFHEKWWDYSSSPFNLKGYICLSFSILWGLACVFVIDLIHPMISGTVRLLPKTVGIIILLAASAVMVVDAALTVAAISKLKRNAGRVDELEKHMRKLSDSIGEKISDGVIVAMEKRPEIEEKLEKLQVKYKNIMEQHAGRRILKAYPNLSNVKRIESLERIRKMFAVIKEKLDNK